MRVAIFSDVHGNLPAFELMLKDVGVVDQYICLGDVVNYGPWSNECVELLETLPNCMKILGNHDQAFIEKKAPGEHPLARQFFDHCLPSFKHVSTLKKYKTEGTIATFIITHTIENKRIYPDTPLHLTADYFIGHTHYQFTTLSNGYILHNPGSVGQNRSNLKIINYSIFQPESKTIEMRHIYYDPEIVIQEMRKKQYPPQCIEYYENKNSHSK